MTNRVYDDEDNAPMIEDPYRKYTTYTCKREADFFEKGGFEQELEAKEVARDIRRSQIHEGFMDDLGIERGSECRECAWLKEAVIEAYEDQADDDCILPEEAYNLASKMCECCKAHTPEQRDDALYDFIKKEKENT